MNLFIDFVHMSQYLSRMANMAYEEANY